MIFSDLPDIQSSLKINIKDSNVTDDPAIAPMRLVGFGGHGICTSFWVWPRQMTIIETPDDASIQIDRKLARARSYLSMVPVWEP